jgi:hypothetical protein
MTLSFPLRRAHLTFIGARTFFSGFAPLPCLALCLGLVSACSATAQSGSDNPDLWQLARKEAAWHRFSTLFDAHDVSRRLASEEGLAAAIAWCKQSCVTKVYLETFRGEQAPRNVLEHAKAKFVEAGFEVSGCVTTVNVGKRSTGWKEVISCYTDPPTQEKLKAVFEYAASLFDEIMIDDFWFTDCECKACNAARQAKTVKIGAQSYPVSGDSWEDYHCELMVRMSRDYVLGAAKKVNPKARLIIKYPQWYDNFHLRGYEVERETADFDRIWVGTETRDYHDKQWGGTVQYEAYFIMRWLGGIGGAKCGGGWFDSLGTTPKTYVEQARQTILGGAAESMLFVYGGLHREPGIEDVAALRANIPELLTVARQVRSRQIAGIAAYKPVNSHPQNEQRIFDFVGMLGLPLAPCHEFPTNALAAFFSAHALKDAQLSVKLRAFIQSGKPVLITDALASGLNNQVDLKAGNVTILRAEGNPKGLLELPQDKVDALRQPLLRPFSVAFKSPNRVALYLFKDGSSVIENFNDQDAMIELDGKVQSVPARGWVQHWK